MNLGLDIDGVLTDIETFQLKFGIPFFKDNFGKNIVNEYGKNIEQLFECTDEEKNKFWLKHLVTYTVLEPARKNASDYTKWAYENGHKIYIITSRVFSTKDNFMGKLMRFIVKNWLKRNKIRYEDIVFCDEDKTDAVKKLDISYMVEDDPDNIEALKEYTKLLCMNAKYNEHIGEDKAKRCYSFDDVIEYAKSWQGDE